ncbi:hypothetical protein IF1G_01081 [Cordyceps javanica]|uniref:Uncharacterized protein n=1 Tax=Cordyceps javanica TaxID=43265 RepID=A0A545VHM0_9HYPO|nr:hypothetical protein IF1G_01081 [Cordyceps javanica]
MHAVLACADVTVANVLLSNYSVGTEYGYSVSASHIPSVGFPSCPGPALLAYLGNWAISTRSAALTHADQGLQLINETTPSVPGRSHRRHSAHAGGAFLCHCDAELAAATATPAAAHLLRMLLSRLPTLSLPDIRAYPYLSRLLTTFVIVRPHQPWLLKRHVAVRQSRLFGDAHNSTRASPGPLTPSILSGTGLVLPICRDLEADRSAHLQGARGSTHCTESLPPFPNRCCVTKPLSFIRGVV